LSVGSCCAVSRYSSVRLVSLFCFVLVRLVLFVLGAVGLVHVAVVRVRAVDRNRHVDVGLSRAGFARGRLVGAVFVVRGLGLVDLLSAVPTRGVPAAADRHAGRGCTLILLVLLLGAVVVRR